MAENKARTRWEMGNGGWDMGTRGRPGSPHPPLPITYYLSFSIEAHTLTSSSAHSAVLRPEVIRV